VYENKQIRPKSEGIVNRVLIYVILAAVLGGCVSTTQVLTMGRDTYTVSATADGYRTAAAARESAFESGMKQCDAIGKKFMFVSENTARTRMNIDTTVSIVFRCLSESDPDYLRPNVQPAQM